MTSGGTCHLEQLGEAGAVLGNVIFRFSTFAVFELPSELISNECIAGFPLSLLPFRGVGKVTGCFTIFVHDTMRCFKLIIWVVTDIRDL